MKKSSRSLPIRKGLRPKYTEVQKEPINTFKSIQIDPEKNMLLCSTFLVGIGEIVEVHSLDSFSDSPGEATGRILEKLKEPNVFVVQATFDGHEAMGRRYTMGEKCIFRILRKNISGMRRRRFALEEKFIIDTVKVHRPEKIMPKAKTGSVRKKKPCKVIAKKSGKKPILAKAR